MSDVGVSIEVDVSAEAAIKLLREVSEELGLVGFLRALGASQLEWVTKNFESEGEPFGGWAPLSPRTIARRRKASNAILQDSGVLKGSFTKSGTGSEFNVSRQDADSVTIGSAVPYASFHELGVKPYKIAASKRGAIHPGIPQRKILPTEEIGRQLAVELAEERLRRIAENGR